MKSAFPLLYIFFILACANSIHNKENAEGKRVNGKRQGVWRIYYPDGRIKEFAEYKGDSLHGSRITFYENGKVHTKAHYNMGVFVDSFFLYFSNGQLEAESWFDSSGKAQGPYKTYYETGEIRAIGRSINDLEEGISKAFYKNKHIMFLIQYKNGKKEGVASYFDEQGNQTKMEIYKNDSLVATTGAQ